MTVNAENYWVRGIGRVAASVNNICIRPVMILPRYFTIHQQRLACVIITINHITGFWHILHGFGVIWMRKKPNFDEIWSESLISLSFITSSKFTEGKWPNGTDQITSINETKGIYSLALIPRKPKAYIFFIAATSIVVALILLYIAVDKSKSGYPPPME